MQPVVGVIADRSTSKYGRRRPFMVMGTIIVSFCLIMLGWTSEIVGLFIRNEDTRKSVTVIVAVLSIYVLDFAINAVQACSRSLIVDTLPISSQQAGSAWATRLSTVGHLVGYFIGTLDMVAIFGTFLGDTQFKKMCIISAAFFLFSVGVTCWAVRERILVEPAASERETSSFKVLSTLIHRTIYLPARIQAICWVQFWSWLGWFIFLFYSSTWVGETYFRYDAPKQSASSASSDTLGDIGRLGSLSLVIFSIVSFIAAVTLPHAVSTPEVPSYTYRPPPSIAKQLHRVVNLRPDLVTTWGFAHAIFAVTMAFAPFVHSVHMATVLVGIAGLPWAIVCWAPFSEMGVEINKLASGTGLDPRGTHALVTTSGPTYQQVPVHELEQEMLETELAEIGRRDIQSHHRARNTSDGILRLRHDSDAADPPSTGELAGIYLGVLNVYTTLPQFVGTFVAWIVFSILEPSKQEDSGNGQPEDSKWLDLKKEAPNAISVCLFVGAIFAVVAVESTRRLKKLQHQ
ncbi:putative sucrose transporter [Phaeomoniella chlamydospora]|uniref:Putative sucrose transporter n=1 Tax=Phaeomoniella chlamydospora TaxID=158046 RepID=A0A0G2DZD5_PHACM|nr:putative sucrose transporter [Phaeomoniella chlamydospora]